MGAGRAWEENSAVPVFSFIVVGSQSMSSTCVCMSGGMCMLSLCLSQTTYSACAHVPVFLYVCVHVCRCVCMCTFVSLPPR